MDWIELFGWIKSSQYDYTYMIGDKIQNNLDPYFVSFSKKLLQIRHCPEYGINIIKIGNILSEIFHSTLNKENEWINKIIFWLLMLIAIVKWNRLLFVFFFKSFELLHCKIDNHFTVYRYNNKALSLLQLIKNWIFFITFENWAHIILKNVLILNCIEIWFWSGYKRGNL